MSADPISLGVGAFKVAGGVAKATGIMKGGASAKEAADVNASIAEDNANAARDKASLEVMRNRRLASKSLGATRAAAGGSGLAQSGSVLDVLAESAATAEEDALLIQHAGDMEATRYTNEAALSRFEGKRRKSASKISAASSLLSTGANVIGSFL